MDLNEFGWEASKCFHGNGWVLPRGNFTEALLWNFFSAHRSPSPYFLTWTNYKILFGGKIDFWSQDVFMRSFMQLLGVQTCHGAAEEWFWAICMAKHWRCPTEWRQCGSHHWPQPISYWFNPHKCWDLVTVGNPTYPQFLMVKPPWPILFSICLFHPNLNEENTQQFTLNITHVCSSYKNSCIRYYIPYHHFSCVETTNQQVQPVLGHLGRLGCWPWWILCLWCLTIQQCSTQHLDDHCGYQMVSLGDGHQEWRSSTAWRFVKKLLAHKTSHHRVTSHHLNLVVPYR